MSQRRRLSIVLGLNIVVIAASIVVGITARSLSVLAAGGDFVADSAAIALGIVAVTVRARKGEQSTSPTYVAGVNATALLGGSSFVFAAGLRRLLEGTPEVHGLPVLIVSAIATAVRLVSVFVLGTRAGSEDLHLRSVLLDTTADAVASAAVAIGGGVIFFTGRFYWVDSVLSVLIALVVGAGAAHLLRDVVLALRTPRPLTLSDDS